MMKALIAFLLVVISFSIAFSSETVKGAKKDVESFKKEMSLKLESVDKELNELRVKAKSKGTATQDKVVKDFETTRDQLRAEIENLESKSKSNWTKFKNDLSSSVDRLYLKVKKSLED